MMTMGNEAGWGRWKHSIESRVPSIVLSIFSQFAWAASALSDGPQKESWVSKLHAEIK